MEEPDSDVSILGWIESKEGFVTVGFGILVGLLIAAGLYILLGPNPNIDDGGHGPHYDRPIVTPKIEATKDLKLDIPIKVVPKRKAKSYVSRATYKDRNKHVTSASEVHSSPLTTHKVATIVDDKTGKTTVEVKRKSIERGTEFDLSLYAGGFAAQGQESSAGYEFGADLDVYKLRWNSPFSDSADWRIGVYSGVKYKRYNAMSAPYRRNDWEVHAGIKLTRRW